MLSADQNGVDVVLATKADRTDERVAIIQENREEAGASTQRARGSPARNRAAASADELVVHAGSFGLSRRSSSSAATRIDVPDPPSCAAGMRPSRIIRRTVIG
jgi:hypothetical protein